MPKIRILRVRRIGVHHERAEVTNRCSDFEQHLFAFTFTLTGYESKFIDGRADRISCWPEGIKIQGLLNRILKYFSVEKNGWSDYHSRLAEALGDC